MRIFLPSRVHKFILKKSAIFILIGCSLMLSCRKENRWDAFKRTGERVTETRTLPGFNKIYLEDNIDIEISYDTVQSIKVEGGKNLVGLITTEVINNELRVSNRNRCNWARSYKRGEIKVYVSVPTLRNITQYGSGTISSTDTIYCDTLNLLTHESGDVDLILKANIIYSQLHGSSDVTLRGISLLHGNYHLGTGYLHCEDLLSIVVWTTSDASGNEYYNATTELSATINWAGDVYYKGSPATHLFGEGKGKLIQQN